MSKSSTTHVIEIETGIGEPAFIPLAVGEELHPVSIGKKGMWRIESPGVLDIHAFVYFDGNALFIQSADESAAASVDGYRVTEAWTELHAPCAIEIGAARLRYRALAAPVSDRSPRSSRRAPGSARSRGEAGAGPISPRHIEEPAQPSSRAARPFKPGEFSRPQPRGESTRVAPVASNPRGASERWGGTEAMHVSDPGPSNASQAPREMTLAMGVDGSSDSRSGNHHHPELSSGFPPGPSPEMVVPPGMMMVPQGTPPLGMMFPSGPGVSPGMAMPDAYAGYPPIGTQSNGPGGEIGGAAPGPAPSVLAKFKELTPAQRALVVLAPFCLISAAYLLLFDDPRPGPVTNGSTEPAADAGVAVVATSVAATSTLTPPVATAPPSCPAGFVPYSVAINGQIPCVPAGTPMPAVANPSASATDAVVAPPPTAVSTSATAAMPATTKTLERQAVDYVANGNYSAAAQIYEQLQRQNPNNRVYAEAARILHAKANAGLP
jgi:hypothetical protein